MLRPRGVITYRPQESLSEGAIGVDGDFAGDLASTRPRTAMESFHSDHLKEKNTRLSNLQRAGALCFGAARSGRIGSSIAAGKLTTFSQRQVGHWLYCCTRNLIATRILQSSFRDTLLLSTRTIVTKGDSR